MALALVVISHQKRSKTMAGFDKLISREVTRLGAGMVGAGGVLCFGSSLVLPAPLMDRCILRVFSIVVMVLCGYVALPAPSPL